jgi:hypothetical protein
MTKLRAGLTIAVLLAGAWLALTSHGMAQTLSTIQKVLQVDVSGNPVTLSTDATTNTASQTTGPQTFCNGSTATPSAVGADGRSIAFWCGTNGQLNVAQNGTWTVQPGNTANSTAWLVQPVPGTTNGASTCVLQSAVSTNATNCKNAAGLLYGLEVINTTSTIYYLRLYNLSAAPTCSSATGFVRSVPIPHNSGAGAGLANFYTAGETYGTGISFCFTGGGSSTDNTNAATGVYLTLHYQ